MVGVKVILVTGYLNLLLGRFGSQEKEEVVLIGSIVAIEKDLVLLKGDFKICMLEVI